MSNKMELYSPQMLQMMQGGGITAPSQDREFTTKDSRFTLWNNAKKSANLAKIEESRFLAVSARTKALKEIMTIMYDMAMAGDRMYQEKYKNEHERKMMNLEEKMAQTLIDKERKMMELAEKMTLAQVTKLERDTMLIELKIQTGLEDLNFMKLENKIKGLSINKRIESGDY